MPFYSDAQKICIIQTYFSSKSYKETKNELARCFPHASIPSDSTILRLVEKFHNKGSIVNIKCKSRKPTAMTDENITAIQSVMMENPRTSTRRLAQQVNVSHTTAYKAIRKELEMFPYKITAVHQLLPIDHHARLHFCEWISEVVQNEPDFLSRCFFTDEAWFYLNGYVNSQNSRQWSCNNPHLIEEATLHPAKVGIWAAMSGKRIFTVFFDSTVTSEVYCGFVDRFVETLTEEEIFRGWFQQDNATAHTANRTMNQLRMYFGDRVISKGLWPPRSPDLSPPDFFLWGYLKDRVYQSKPQTLNALRQCITEKIAEIPFQMLNAVSGSVISRIQMCIAVNGAHFQHL